MNIRKSKVLRRKSLIGKILRLPFKLIPANAVIPILRGPLKGMKWIKGSHNLSVLLGTYERVQSKEFTNASRHASVFWDLGAHVGYYSLLYHSANPNGKAFAFEPVAKNADFLEKHTEMNNVSGIRLFRVAVSNQGGKLSFNTGKTSVAGRIESGGTTQVDVIQLSAYVREDRLPLPDLIKMDIEGEEFKVLQDLRTILQSRKPVLFVSTHGAEVHRQCVAILTELQYRCTPLDSKDLDSSREILAC